MKLNGTFAWSVAASLCVSGCVVLSGEEAARLRQRIYDTHRRVASLDQSLAQTAEDLREEARQTRADLNESMKSVVEDARRTRGQVDENTYYVRELSEKLDAIIYSLRPTADTSVKAQGAEPTPQATGAPPSQPVLAPVSPEGDYRRAKQDYDRGNYDIARMQFEEYLRLYPDSQLAPNAQFWLAECYYKSDDLQRAIQEFKKVYNAYPKNVKIPDAMLNEAYAQIKLKHNREAVRLLKKVIADYPVSPAAQSAKIKLDALAKQGVDISG